MTRLRPFRNPKTSQYQRPPVRGSSGQLSLHGQLFNPIVILFTYRNEIRLFQFCRRLAELPPQSNASETASW
jgi:hypothetical protein